MNEQGIQVQIPIKQEHSQIFTLRSIDSQDEIIQIVPAYRKSQSNIEIKSGHWTAKQHIKYIMFLDFFSNLFILKHNKKLWKIFTIMSSFIKTRNSSQCRSHHQKTQRKFNNVEEILKQQRSKYKNYDLQFQYMKKKLQKLPIQNPIQIEKQKSTTQFLPSIKVLDEPKNYETYRISLSLIDINEKKIKKNKQKLFGSQKIVIYQREKYIGSECSIELEDQNEQCFKDKSKQASNCFMNQQKQNKNSVPWGYLIPQSSQKNQKLVKTIDTQTDPNHNRIHNNFVKMRKAKSDYHSTFDDSQQMEKSENYSTKKKQSVNSAEEKCRSQPPNSDKQDSQQSWFSQKINNCQEPQIKSLFSGFVSSLQSVSKNFEINHKINLGHQQYTSFGKFCSVPQPQEEEEVFFLIKKKKSKIQKQFTQKDQFQNSCFQSKNIFFCQDFQKGNLCNQLSDGGNQSFQQCIEFFPFQVQKKEKVLQIIQAVDQEKVFFQNQFSKNFTKKKSNQISQVHVTKKKTHETEDWKVNQNNSNQELQEKQIQYNSLCQSQIKKSQLNNINSQPHYNPIQYPLINYYVNINLEFLIYFLIWKINMSNMRYQTYQ